MYFIAFYFFQNKQQSKHMLCGLQGFTKRVPKIVGILLALLFPAIKPERRERKETVREFKVSVGGFSVQDQARDDM